MTRIPPCCCEEAVGECAYMFLRKKTLGYYPVFGTPAISIWTKVFQGYTGISGGINGLTGCTVRVVTGPDGKPVNSWENIGVTLDNVVYKSDLFANIPGDNLWYTGATLAGVEPPHKTFVYGALVLPKKYEGITLDNTIVGEDGNLYYQLVKGAIPDSVRPFKGSQGVPSLCYPIEYKRADDVYIGGVTAGTNYEKDVSLLRVYYSDAANTALKGIKPSDVQLIYSLDSTAIIPTGTFLPDVSPGCRPCRRTFEDREICYNGPARSCGGTPYAYFQTVPENIDIININLKICKNENNSSFISITDTSYAGNFTVQKALVTSTHNCGPAVVDCSNEKTLFGGICCSDAEGTFDACPVHGLGKGFVNAFENCTLIPIIPCNTDTVTCADAHCNDTSPDPSTDNQVPIGNCIDQHYLAEIIYVERYEECDPDPDYACGVNDDGSIIPATCISHSYEHKWYLGPTIFQVGDWWAGSGYVPTKMPGTDIPYCGYTEPITTPGCRGYLRFHCDLINFTVPGCNANIEIPYDQFYISHGNDFCCGGVPPLDSHSPQKLIFRSPCHADDGTLTGCCCCGGTEGCPQSGGDLGNIMCITLRGNTSFSPNPYVMYTNNSAYFETVKGKSVPNFINYLKHYFETWANDRRTLYPEVDSYKVYIKNPKCNAGAVPDYFFYSNSRPITGENFFYDQDRCVNRYTKIPNWDPLCKEQFLLSAFKKNCGKNIPHYAKIEDLSYKLACDDNYTESPCWKELSKHWPMENIEYYGMCNGEGLTLTIERPKGLTLGNCTNILSWEFLKNAPKQ